MTILERLKAELRPLGMAASKRDGEYRINFLFASDDSAYYTECYFDAVSTAKDMAARRDVKL